MDFVQARPQPASLTAETVFDAWRNLSRREWLAALLFGISMYLMHRLPWMGPDVVRDLPGWASKSLRLFVLCAIAAVILMLAVVVADRVTGMNADRRAPYIIAVVIGTAAGVILEALALGLGLITPFAADNFFGHTLFQFCDRLALGGLATFVYLDRRRAQAEIAHLHRQEVERARTAKHLTESRLQAMQARVEPQFLFNTLAQVKHLYEMHLDLAQRMLDDLIAYLRAAMPRMRDTTSTVAQEMELARAYLEIMKVRLGDRLAVEFQIPQGVGDARMPPMMLLPLIDHAIAHGLGPTQSSGTIRIGVDVASGKLRLVIVDSGAGFVPAADGDGIASIRERLVALYGNDARLDLKRGEAESTHAVMVIPYETRHVDDDNGGAAILGHESKEA